MNPNDVALLVAGALVAILSLAFRELKPSDDEKQGVEIVVSLLAGFGVLLFLGKLSLPAFPKDPATFFKDALAFLQALVAVSAPVFALAEVIYLFLRDKLQDAVVNVVDFVAEYSAKPTKKSRR